MSDHPTIETISVRAVETPLANPVRTAAGAIETAPLLLIDIRAREGLTGRAYLFGYHRFALRPLADLVTTLAEPLLGQRVDPARQHEAMARRLRLLGPQGLAGMALSGLDMALWDLAARAAGRPLVTYLGATPRPIRAYASFGIIDPRADASMLRSVVDQGFQALKFKIGGASAAEDLATARAVRDIVGPGMGLMVDFNQALEPAEALARLADLATLDLIWAEEPVLADDLVSAARITRASPVPIQAGENWWFPEGFEAAAALGASAMIMPDLMKVGGISGWMRVARLAASTRTRLSSHILHEASAHVLAASPTADWIEYLDLAGLVLAEPLTPVDGAIAARGAGLGLDWDEVAVARFAL